MSLPSAREVLRTKIGDCNEHTALYVAMARALAPEETQLRLANGRVCFNWYRIDVAIPERVGDLDPTGAAVVFEVVIDDYAEVWVNGQRVNGELLQDGNTHGMIFDVPHLIEYISRFMTLKRDNHYLVLGPWDHGARVNASPWRARTAAATLRGARRPGRTPRRGKAAGPTFTTRR